MFFTIVSIVFSSSPVHTPFLHHCSWRAATIIPIRSSTEMNSGRITVLKNYSSFSRTCTSPDGNINSPNTRSISSRSRKYTCLGVMSVLSNHTLRVFLDIIPSGKSVFFWLCFLLLMLTTPIHFPPSLLPPSYCALLLFMSFYATTHLPFLPSTKEWPTLFSWNAHLCFTSFLTNKQTTIACI